MVQTVEELERVRSAVLARYGPALGALDWVSLAAGGGFSGAFVWRGEDRGSPVFALKAWPPRTKSSRLALMHGRMGRAVSLPFVPAVVPTLDGHTVVVVAERPWDVTAWMPGSADFHADPSPTRLANACAAL